MGAAMSTVMIAAGAILRFAVSVTTTGFNLHTIGLILIILGALALVLSIAFWGSWAASTEARAAGIGVSVASHRTERADSSKKNAPTPVPD